MPLSRTALIHPSLTYRLTGSLIEAAAQRALGFHTGQSLWLDRHGRALASVRAYGDACFELWTGNSNLVYQLALTPGFVARFHFAQAAGEAESLARVTHWS
ncbi:MAG TPA: hypothetical protein VD713_02545 [Sphingomonadales bacterium]|nr:hypothetical protein [Sphingomonadales bacterium]